MKLGFCSILALMLVLFKLLGTLEISWIWALSPIWIGASISLLFLGLFTLAAFLIAFIGGKK